MLDALYESATSKGFPGNIHARIDFFPPLTIKINFLSISCFSRRNKTEHNRVGFTFGSLAFLSSYLSKYFLVKQRNFPVSFCSRFAYSKEIVLLLNSDRTKFSYRGKCCSISALAQETFIDAMMFLCCVILGRMHFPCYYHYLSHNLISRIPWCLCFLICLGGRLCFVLDLIFLTLYNSDNFKIYLYK